MGEKKNGIDRDPKSTSAFNIVNRRVGDMVRSLEAKEKVNHSLVHLLKAGLIQIEKGQDYQSPHSTVTQYDYYPRGLETMMDTMQSKMLRIRSLIERHKAGEVPSNEGIEDSLYDLINTASFALSFMNGKMDGQPSDVDMLNKKKEVKA